MKRKFLATFFILIGCIILANIYFQPLNVQAQTRYQFIENIALTHPPPMMIKINKTIVPNQQFVFTALPAYRYYPPQKRTLYCYNFLYNKFTGTYFTVSALNKTIIMKSPLYARYPLNQPVRLVVKLPYLGVQGTYKPAFINNESKTNDSYNTLNKLKKTSNII